MAQKSGSDSNGGDSRTIKAGDKKAASNVAKNGKETTDISDKGETVSMCPPPRLGQFYDFFTFAHLNPPIQCELNSNFFRSSPLDCKIEAHGQFQFSDEAENEFC